MSLADRMKILKEKEEQWKSKGKGAANDSNQFTVAGRMAKKGETILWALFSTDNNPNNCSPYNIIHRNPTLPTDADDLYLITQSVLL